MLDDIINKNAELKKHPAIIPILKKIESIIPLNVRDNFYHNLSTLKVVFASDKDKEHAFYEFKKNKLFICTNFDEFLLDDWPLEEQEKIKQEMMESTLCHEFMHMASTKYYADINLVNTGFSSIINDEKILNCYLNEGFTEMFAEILYPKAFISSGYKDISCIAKIITSIVGLNEIKNLYFSNGLAIRLQNYMMNFADANSVKALFYNASGIQWCKIENDIDSYNHYLKSVIFDSLIPILNNAIIVGIKNGVFKSEEELKNYYNTYIKFNFDYLINTLLKNGYDQNLLNDYMEEACFDINNYNSYFTNNIKLGYVSIYVLLSILLIVIGIVTSLIVILF